MLPSPLRFSLHPHSVLSLADWQSAIQHSAAKLYQTLPLLHAMEERVGERRRIGLLGLGSPLPMNRSAGLRHGVVPHRSWNTPCRRPALQGFSSGALPPRSFSPLLRPPAGRRAGRGERKKKTRFGKSFSDSGSVFFRHFFALRHFRRYRSLYLKSGRKSVSGAEIPRRSTCFCQ